MTRRVLLRLPLALLMLILVAGPAAAAGPNRVFVAPLWGRQEVPSVQTRSVGLALFKLNSEETEMKYALIVAKGDDVTQAHIHCGAPGVNGPVVVFLYGLGPTVDVNGILATGVITAGSVIPRPDSPACPGGVADLADVLQKMRSGEAYANVHTVEFPGGEIRGKIF